MNHGGDDSGVRIDANMPSNTDITIDIDTDDGILIIVFNNCIEYYIIIMSA